MARTLNLLIALFLFCQPAMADVTVPTASQDLYQHMNFNRNGIYLLRDLYLADDSGNTLRLFAPDLADDDTVFKLPPDNGADGQPLLGDGAGALDYGPIDLGNSDAFTGVLDPANGGTGVANNAAATLTRTGNHALTLTTTATTDVTLPTTGTVATSSDISAHSDATTSVHGVTGDVVGTSDAQSLSAKTFSDAVTLTEIATPTNPDAGEKKIYPKDDGRLYTLDSAGVEKAVGTGVGGGDLNFNINPNGDPAVDNSGTDDVGDYIAVGGTGCTVAKVTSGLPLGDLRESGVQLTFADDSSGAEYCRLRFKIPSAYRGEKLRYSHRQLSDSYVEDSATVELYSYSDNYSTPSGGTPVTLSPVTGGGPDLPTYTGEFSLSFVPTDTTRGYYELRYVNDGATAGTLTLNDVKIDAPGNTATFPATEWTSFTPSITGLSGGTTAGFYRRIGDSAQIQYFVSGATWSSSFTPQMPPGLEINNDAIGAASAGRQVIGKVVGYDASLADYYSGAAFTNGNNDEFWIGGDSASSIWGSSIPFTWNNGADQLSIFIEVPISGWSSGAYQIDQNNSSLPARVRYYSSTTASPAANTAWPYDTLSTSISKLGNWSNSSGEITVPSAGTYTITARGKVTSWSADHLPYLAIGGTRSVDFANLESTDLAFNVTTTQTITDPATQTLSIRNTVNATTIQSGDVVAWIDIVRSVEPGGNVWGALATATNPGLTFQGNWVDLTLTDAALSGWAVTSAKGQAFRDTAGNWSASVVISATFTPSANAAVFTIDGTAPAAFSALASYGGSSHQTTAEITTSGVVTSPTSASRSRVSISGHFLCSSEPTWAAD